MAWQFPAPAGSDLTSVAAGEAWWRLEPARDGSFEAHTRGSAADTEIAVFDSCAAGARPLAFDDDTLGLQSAVGFPVEAGADRWIRVRQRSGRASDPVLLTVRGAATGISGVVTEAATGNPISDTWVEIRLRENGAWWGSDYTDATGAYTVEGLEGGVYVALTEFSDEHLDELWDDRPCDRGCDVTTGDPILVTEGGITTGIDFELLRAGSISGRLRDSETGEALPDFNVVVVDAAGSWVDSVHTDDAGRYSAGGLTPGVHFAFTSGSGYRNEVYDDIPCLPACQPEDGTPIQVGVEEAVRDVDFDLDPLGSIAGTVVDASNGLPIPFLSLSFHNALGDWTGWAQTDALGRYLGGGLEQGLHFVTTEAYSRYRNEVYDNIPCSGQGSGFCDPLSGTAVAVLLGETTPGIDFALDRLGVFSGILVDDSSADPLPFLEVAAWDAVGGFAESGDSNALGIYVVEDLAAGTYYATTDNALGYLDELYDDLPCQGDSWPGCDPTIGTPIAVALGETTGGVDFALPLGGAIAGALSDATTGEPIRSELVRLWDASGSLAAYGQTDDAGNYLVNGLAGGTYFATSQVGSHLEELYDDLPCPNGAPESCDPTTGTPILVTVGATTVGIDMDLVLRGGLSGVVTAMGSGLPVSGAAVDVWNDDGSLVASAATNAMGRYQVDLTSGSYLVSTDAGRGYLEELYDDVPCPDGPAILGLCDPLDGALVPVIGAEPVVMGIDFALARPLFADGFESGDTSAWSASVP